MHGRRDKHVLDILFCGLSDFVLFAYNAHKLSTCSLLWLLKTNNMKYHHIKTCANKNQKESKLISNIIITLMWWRRYIHFIFWYDDVMLVC